MNCFDVFFTEEEIIKIEKLDYLYTNNIISLDDKENQPKLDLYVYEIYLKDMSNADTEEGGANE